MRGPHDPNWEAIHARAVAAGKVTCSCGFTYYRSGSGCPLCRKPEPPRDPTP